MYSSQDIESLTSPKDKNPYVVIKDNAFDDILAELCADTHVLRHHMRPAKMSRGDQLWEDNNVRGDSLCWVTPQLCEELGLRTLDMFVQRMKTECQVMAAELGLVNEYNMQFAIYPGKGEGYNRHKDAFSDPASSANDSAPLSRQLTCLLYLNKDWEHQDGGQLRVFMEPGVFIEGAGEPFSFWGVSGYDIDPLFGRLVVFRSELVSHAVLPCYHERMALTFWLNGTGPAVSSSSAPSVPMVFKFSPTNPSEDAQQEEDCEQGMSDEAPDEA